MDLQIKCLEASALAKKYNWPKEAEALSNGKVPEGFGKEVGKEIALFLKPDVISKSWLGVWTKEQEEEYKREMREHARQLAKLRILIALINIESKKERQ